MVNTRKNPIVVTVFSLGAIFGLVSFGLATMALFTLGQNDSQIASLMAFSCMFLFLPLCFLAFWKLRLAGFCFLVLTVLWTSSILVQYHFENTRGMGHSLTDSGGLLIYSALFLFFGVFALKVDRTQRMLNESRRDSASGQFHI